MEDPRKLVVELLTKLVGGSEILDLRDRAVVMIEQLQAQRDAAEAKLTEVRTNFAIQAGRVREVVARAEKAEANVARLKKLHERNVATIEHEAERANENAWQLHITVGRAEAAEQNLAAVIRILSPGSATNAATEPASGLEVAADAATQVTPEPEE